MLYFCQICSGTRISASIARRRSLFRCRGLRSSIPRMPERRSLRRRSTERRLVRFNPVLILTPRMLKQKQQQCCCFYFSARGQGFEPRLTGPEPVVLPLDDPRICFLPIF